MASHLSPLKQTPAGAIVALALPLAHATAANSATAGVAGEYLRLHDSAVAETAAKLSDRYEGALSARATAK